MRKIRVLSEIAIIMFVVIACLSCKKNIDIDPGNDPNFVIIANSDDGLKAFNRKVEVFGIPIYAVKKVSDQNLLHAANIMAQYLDNDEDGIVDNQLVLDAMIESDAFVIMWKNKLDLMRISPPDGREGQDLGNDETCPDWHISKSGRFDASLEEIWHIITHAGYSKVYPEVFGEYAGTEISNAMDIARGGNFTEIPSTYPESAWYSYNDKTCVYDCQVTEYFYWAMTSLLGAQETRLDEIKQEWKLNTRELLEAQDTSIYQILTDPQYILPTVLPDGTYMR